MTQTRSPRAQGFGSTRASTISTDEGQDTDDEPSVPWRVRDAALLLVLGWCVLVLGVVCVQGLYQLQGGNRAVPSQPPAILTVMASDLFYLALLAGTWWLVVRRYRLSWSVIGLCRLRRGSLSAVVTLSGILTLGSLALIFGTVWLLAALRLGPRLVIVGVTPADPLFGVLAAGSLLLAPVADELFFRGVLYQALRKHLGVALSATLSAVMFVAAHPLPALAPEYLLLGIVLAVAFEQTGSLYPPIALHALYNGAIMLFALHTS